MSAKCPLVSLATCTSLYNLRADAMQHAFFCAPLGAPCPSPHSARVPLTPPAPQCRRDLAMHQLRQGITAAEADEEEAAAEAAAAAAAAAAAGEQPKGEGSAEGRGGGDEQPPAEQAFVSESKLQALLKEVRVGQQEIYCFLSKRQSPGG